MTKTPFHVHAYPGELLGKFQSETNAIRVAQMWSKIWGSWTEVINDGKGGGIIAQFNKGEMAPEFSANHVDSLRTWSTHCEQAFL